MAHSKSPAIHRFWLGRLGLDGDYGRFPVAPEDVEAAIKALPALGLRGVNVTVPHKQAVIPFLDRLDPLAEKIGAVNLIVVEDGQLVGYNSDVAGFLDPLCGLVTPASHAIVIGAGGAARAIAASLWSLSYSLTIANRDRSRAREIADATAGERSNEISTPSLDQLRDLTLGPAPHQPENIGLVVNATSLGMKGQDALDISLSNLNANVVIYDIVYTPLETPLLAEARERGHPVIDGLQMLVGQARTAFEKFYGVAPPGEHDDELRALLTR